MKLYATTTSERASKGQGGNEYIVVDLNVFETQVGQIELYYNNDIKNGADTDEWVLQFRKGSSEDDNDWDIIAQGNVIPETKGKSQKGDRLGVCHCGHPCVHGTYYCERHQLP